MKPKGTAIEAWGFTLKCPCGYTAVAVTDKAAGEAMLAHGYFTKAAEPYECAGEVAVVELKKK